jgi:4-azaleucine resistance transporter AzlC
MRLNKKKFYEGLRLGLPIAIGYIPIAITFGLIIQSSEISISAGMLMSLIVFAGASQFIGANLMIVGAASLEIVITTFILNFRHFLMSSSLAQKVKPNTSKKFLSLIAFGITDESFAVASLQEEEVLDPYKIFGLNLIAYLSWNLGTWIGLFAGSTLPSQLKSSLGIALYVMFIGLLIPSLKKGKTVIIVSILSMVINSFMYWMPMLSRLSVGWRIIIATILSAFIGTFISSGEDSE